MTEIIVLAKFCMFWVQNLFLKKFLNRSASFFGQEAHEQVKTSKKRYLEAKHDIFVEMH